MTARCVFVIRRNTQYSDVWGRGIGSDCYARLEQQICVSSSSFVKAVNKVLSLSLANSRSKKDGRKDPAAELGT